MDGHRDIVEVEVAVVVAVALGRGAAAAAAAATTEEDDGFAVTVLLDTGAETINFLLEIIMPCTEEEEEEEEEADLPIF